MWTVFCRRRQVSRLIIIILYCMTTWWTRLICAAINLLFIKHGMTTRQSCRGDALHVGIGHRLMADCQEKYLEAGWWYLYTDGFWKYAKGQQWIWNLETYGCDCTGIYRNDSSEKRLSCYRRHWKRCGAVFWGCLRRMPANFMISAFRWDWPSSCKTIIWMYGDPKAFGKKYRGDILCNKKTLCW